MKLWKIDFSSNSGRFILFHYIALTSLCIRLKYEWNIYFFSDVYVHIVRKTFKIHSVLFMLDYLLHKRSGEEAGAIFRDLLQTATADSTVTRWDLASGFTRLSHPCWEETTGLFPSCETIRAGSTRRVRGSSSTCLMHRMSIQRSGSTWSSLFMTA